MVHDRCSPCPLTISRELKNIDHLKPVAVAQQPTHHACWQGAVGHIQADQLWQSTAAVHSLPIRHVLLLIHQLRKKYGKSRRVQAATGADVEACEGGTALGYSLQILQDNLLRSIAQAMYVTWDRIVPYRPDPACHLVETMLGLWQATGRQLIWQLAEWAIGEGLSQDAV